MEIIAFTVAGIGLYFLCDWVLNMLEKMHGDALPQRNLVFFVLILALSISSFSIIRMLMDTDQGTPDNYQEQQTTSGTDQATEPIRHVFIHVVEEPIDLFFVQGLKGIPYSCLGMSCLE